MAQVKISELPVAAAALNAMQLEVNDAGTSRSLTLEKVFTAPTFTGVPAAPTAAAGVNTTQIATTAHVFAAVSKSADADFTVDPTLFADRAAIKTLVDASGAGVGIGQTWQALAGSRSEGTTYQNTTGKPIGVSISINGSSGREYQVSVNGSTWIALTSMPSGRTASSFIVPDNWYYRLTGGGTTIEAWAELR
jgi:hypothetical protein